MPTTRFRGLLICICTLAAGLVLAACDDDIAPYDGLGGLDDGTTGDSDTNETVDDCTDVEWGSGLSVGQPVANWSQSGYVDDDGDYVVEEEEVTFALEDVNCAGHNAIVLLIGDTT